MPANGQFVSKFIIFRTIGPKRINFAMTTPSENFSMRKFYAITGAFKRKQRWKSIVTGMDETPLPVTRNASGFRASVSIALPKSALTCVWFGRNSKRKVAMGERLVAAAEPSSSAARKFVSVAS